MIMSGASIFSAFVFIVCGQVLIHASTITTSADWRGTICTRNICDYPNEHSLRFFVLGDFGGQDRHPYTTPIQLEAANSLNNASALLRPQFYLTTGDNFYENGVRDLQDPRFNATYENVYTYGKKERIPWYAMAGNHDYYGSIQAQMDYSGVNPRWIFPALHYPIRYSFGHKRLLRSSATTVEFFLIDTMVLCGDIVMGGWNPWTREYVKPSDIPQGPKNVTAAEEMYAWLENHLQKSKADYLFVVGHYPIYSTGKHGDTKCLTERLPGMLMKYRVNAYMCGHDHQIQHLRMIGPNGWTVHHVVSGASSKTDRRYSPPSQITDNTLNVVTSMFVFPNSRQTSGQGGYVYAEIREQQAVFDYYRGDGEHMYNFVLRPRNLGGL